MNKKDATKMIILLLTYKCTLECDHCYLFSSPRAEGTLTLSQIREILLEAVKVGTIERINFQGGEPFLFYSLMLEGMKIARDLDFDFGFVTNGYWATSIEDAAVWLKPFQNLGISDSYVTDDSFHFGESTQNPAKTAVIAAKQLCLPVKSFSVEKPVFRGRAVEKLSEGLPRRSWEEFITCPCDYVNLEHPTTIYIDSYGTVQPFCQGLSLGNIWEIPLSELLKSYDAYSHPICGPLLEGGPAQLKRQYNLDLDGEYIDECHFCYLTRCALIDKFPQYLTPRQVYGIA